MCIFMKKGETVGSYHGMRLFFTLTLQRISCKDKEPQGKLRIGDKMKEGRLAVWRGFLNSNKTEPQ